jgi:hypothetical protein
MAWKFLNLQPLGKLEEDCVTRAISLATGQDYKTIQEKLLLISELFECEKLCVCCYKHLLDYVYNFERIEAVQGMTIEEFLEEFDIGIFIIRVDGHLTCAIDGNIIDTWDCTNKIVDIVWFVIE